MPLPNDVLEAKSVMSARLLSAGAESGVVGRSRTLSVMAAAAAAGNNVHAVGVGHKMVDGQLTDEPCIRLYVVQKLAESVRNVTFKQIGNYVVAFVSSAVALMVLAKVLTTLFGTFVSENALLLVRWKDTLRRLAIALIISTVGWVAAFLHLYIFDKRFLSLSTLEKIKQKNG